jgi:lipopolysaccharide biosynthesis protein
VAFHQPFFGHVVRYSDVAQACLERQYPHANVFRTVFPAWDNTPRVGSRSLIVLGSTPGNYEQWLARAIARTTQDFPATERLVFINAWNEWAEGCHLEPDRKFGRGYLEATLRARNGAPMRTQGFSYDQEQDADIGAKRSLLADLWLVTASHAYALIGSLSEWLKKFPRLHEAIKRLLNGGR